MKPKVYKELFALVLDGNILTPDSFKEFWKNYSSNELYGWRPPKKIYYTIGYAKAGRHHVPAQIRDRVEIHRFVSVGKVEE